MAPDEEADRLELDAATIAHLRSIGAAAALVIDAIAEADRLDREDREAS